MLLPWLRFSRLHLSDSLAEFHFPDFENDTSTGITDGWIFFDWAYPDSYYQPYGYKVEAQRVIIDLMNSPGLGGLLRLVPDGNWVDDQYRWFDRNRLVRFVSEVLGVRRLEASNGNYYLTPFEILQHGDAYLLKTFWPLQLKARFETHNGNFLFTLLASGRETIFINDPAGPGIEIHTIRELMDLLTNPDFEQPAATNHVGCMLSQFLLAQHQETFQFFNMAFFGNGHDSSSAPYQQVAEMSFFQTPLFVSDPIPDIYHYVNEFALGNARQHHLVTACGFDDQRDCVYNSIAEYHVDLDQHWPIIRRISRIADDEFELERASQDTNGGTYITKGVGTPSSASVHRTFMSVMQINYLYTPRFFDYGWPTFSYMDNDLFSADSHYYNWVTGEYANAFHFVADNVDGLYYDTNCVLEQAATW